MSNNKSFFQIKSSFYSNVNNIELFSGKSINYLKVALDGIKINYISNSNYSTHLFKPYFVYFFQVFLKFVYCILKGDIFSYIKHVKIAKENYNPDLMILDVGRSIDIDDEKYVSLYFHKLFNDLIKNNKVFYSSEKPIQTYKYFKDIYDDRSKFRGCFINNKFSFLRKDILKVFDKITVNSTFNKNELENIKCAFQNFYDDVLYWYPILKSLQPKKIYFICHYHKEGFLYVAKLLKIKTFEFQHGLIAKSDIFYNFPDGLKEYKEIALFADHIFTYGKHWSNLLVEGNSYKTDQISEIGYYLTESSGLKDAYLNKLNIKNFEKVIVVSSQPGFADYFISYIHFMLNHIKDENLDYLLILKLHPLDDEFRYKSEFSTFNNCEINSTVSFSNLMDYADVNITCYSTTVFDALRCLKPSFLLEIPEGMDYVNELLTIHNFKTLKLDDFPQLNDLTLEGVDIDYYYKT